MPKLNYIQIWIEKFVYFVKMPPPVLKNPFIVDWRQTNKENSSNIITSLKNILGPVRKSASKSMENIAKQEIADVDQTFLTKFKPFFVFGINQVLKGLEKKTLSCAIFDRITLKLQPVAYQIGLLCVNSGAHCGCLDDLSETLSPILNTKSAMAIGVKNIDATGGELLLIELVETIKINLNSVVTKSADGESSFYSTPLVVLPVVNNSKKRKAKKPNKKLEKKRKKDKC